jgi:Tfp pilus assembly protein PilV
MRYGGKGEGGFIESMMAVMVVIIALTAFLSLLAYSTSYDNEKDISIPANMFNDVCVVNGSIEAPLENRMNDLAERNGYLGITVMLSTADPLYDSAITITVGSSDADRIWSGNGTIIAGTDDGRSVPVKYSMAVWY